MKQLFIFYERTYQHITWDESLPSMTAGNSVNDDLTIHAFEIDPTITFKQSDNKREVMVLQEDKHLTTLEEGKPYTLTLGNHELNVIYDEGSFKQKEYYVGDQLLLELPKDTLKSDYITLVKQEKNWLLEPSNEKVYLNGELTDQVSHVQCGDIIFYHYQMYVLTEHDCLTVSSMKEPTLRYTEMKRPTSVLKQKYPAYRRTPRMIYELPDEKVTFSFPSEEGEDNRRSLMLIIAPPLMMLLVMGIVALVRPRGIFIIISIAMFGTTLVTSTVQYFREKKKQRERNEKRIRLYTRYLKEKRQELQALSDKQRDVLYYHFPSFERMKYLTNEISERIFERTIRSEDFLQFRVGRANVPATYEVYAQRGDTSNQEIDDLFEESQQLVAHYKQVKNLPLTIDLSSGSMGMIGKYSIVKKEIQQIVGQICFAQSYHDVRFVAIFDEEEYESWKWMKYLPHFQLPHTYAKGLIYNEQTRDQLLTSLHEMVKQRDLEEEKESKLFSPHFIFIVTNRQLISEHMMMEYLEGDHPNLGITTVFAAHTKESLSENIHTLVRYIDETEGDILIQQQKAVHIPFKLDRHDALGNENFARTLKSLDHQLGMSNSIPEKVTFLELFHAEHAHEIPIKKYWLANQSSKSLAVPIGLKGKEDKVYLNLHEKAHGPHGLLAGTTGSGKSELLQSYILSLAVNYHPHEVAFLLIDYKGGGMAQPFKEMPHLLGTITNIEGSRNFSERALASIKSELNRRQRLFDKYHVNHINDYMDLYKSDIAKDPLPHLFLISDEFAELKSEEPDFIHELVSAARIGRSLGVHLILATQKPGGIIDDQIWSNARFRIALKVQDESDSKEILQNPDAAKLTVTGRGYLQVGSNEVYELFQSAWSGAPYTEEAYGTEDAVALVTDLGLVPLSDIAPEESGPKIRQTEIDVVVDEIAKVQQALAIEKLSSPWLPPLPERLEQVEADVSKGQFVIGLMDEPEHQRQLPFFYEAIKDGNIGIFGSSGYGKSTTILTLLLQFSLENSPEMFQYYIFDFGNGALLPLEQLPHTGDYFRSDDVRKIEKFMDFIHEEMDRRKELFRDKQVSNIQMFNLLSEQPLPLIFVTLDNFDLVKEELQELESRFVQIARDGQSLGVYTILSATRANAVRQALMSNLKTKVVHYLLDTTERFTILGRTKYEVEPIPGRAYTQKDDAFLTQISQPTRGETDMDVLENVKEVVNQLTETYEGATKPKGMPMLPRKLDFIAFYKDYNVVRENMLIPIGLDENNVEPMYLDLNKQKHYLIVGDAQKGKTNVLTLVIETMANQKGTKIGLLDAVNHGLAHYASHENIDYLNGKENLQVWISAVTSELKERETIYRDALHQGNNHTVDFEPIILLIDGIGNFQQNSDNQLQTTLADLIKNKGHLGFSLFITGSANEFSKGFDPFTNEVKQVRQALLLMKKVDQSMFHLPFTRNEPEIEPGFGYFVKDGTATKIQIPHFERERMVST